MNDAQTPAPSGSGWTAGRIIGLALSSIAALVGICLLLAGLAVIAIHAFARDDDGFYTSDKEALRVAGYAITTDRINLDVDVADDLPDDLLGTLRVRAEGVGGRSIFVAIGRSADVNGYLGGVPHSQFVDFTRGRPVLDEVPGDRKPRGAPASQGFWVAQSEGVGEQQVEWDVESGVWTVAVMNAGAARGIAVEADIGARIGWLIWVGVGLTLVGALITGTAVIVVVSVGRRASPV